MNTMSWTRLGAVAALGFALAGCASMDTRERDTATGAAIGGAAGAVLGGDAASTLGGAAIGGVIGNQVGKERERRERDRR